jgi:hypothetical protein
VALRQNGSFRMGSAVCRRGHVITDQLRPDRLEDALVTRRCSECGGRVLTACPTCQRRVAGDLFVPGVLAFATPAAPSFCDGCGAAFPWASRDERIMELENALDEGGVADADLAIIRVQLDLLRSGDASEKDERKSWQTIKSRAGAVFMNERVQISYSAWPTLPSVTSWACRQPDAGKRYCNASGSTSRAQIRVETDVVYDEAQIRSRRLTFRYRNGGRSKKLPDRPVCGRLARECVLCSPAGRA